MGALMWLDILWRTNAVMLMLLIGMDHILFIKVAGESPLSIVIY